MPTLLVLPVCGKCSERQPTQPFTVEVREGGIYSVTCPNQHNQVVRLQHRSFEILFELGALAFLDGYYREAVLDFAAALERFLEFCVRFLCFKHGLSEEQVSNTWKGVARQSERQLGAFLFLYALDQQTSVKYVSGQASEFRNNVVHRGYVPSDSEALEYGDEVLNYIRPILYDLKTRQNELMMRFISQELSRSESETGLSVTLGVEFETILSHAYAQRPLDSMPLCDVLPRYQDFIRTRRERQLPGFVLAESA